MPRFFFHTEDGEVFRDKAGALLPDMASARREGVKVLGELIAHDPELFLKTESFKIIIQDEDHLTLYLLELSGLAAPATERRR